MSKKPEDLKKMTQLEISTNTKLAAGLYATFSKETKDNTDQKSFIFGFLHGIEKAYDEIGMFDNPDDIDNVMKFIEKHISRMQK